MTRFVWTAALVLLLIAGAQPAIAQPAGTPPAATQPAPAPPAATQPAPTPPAATQPAPTPPAATQPAPAPPAAGPPESTLKRILETKTIRLGYNKEAVPFSFVKTEGNPMGYSIDLCQRVAAGIKEQLQLPELKLEWVPVTIGDRFQKVKDGTIDLECGTSTNTISRQKEVEFSLMTWIDAGSFLVKAGQPTKSLSDMAGKRIAVIEGTTTDRTLRRALAQRFVNAQVIPVKGHQEGLDAIKQGAADAYSADQTVLIGLWMTAGKEMNLALSEHNFSYEPFGLVMRRNDADFKQAVNQVLAGLYRTGKVLEIYDRWFKKLGKPFPLLMTMYGLNGLPE